MRTLNKLTAVKVSKAKQNGPHGNLLGDGGGLYLQISAVGTKAWLFRYARDGSAKVMGLGSAHSVSLADARVKASEYRKLLADGLDPIQVREAGRAKLRLEAAQAITFKEAAERHIRDNEAGWRNPKHRQQWKNTLKTYVYPVIGSLPVQSIDTALVLQVIKPL